MEQQQQQHPHYESVFWYNKNFNYFFYSVFFLKGREVGKWFLGGGIILVHFFKNFFVCLESGG